MHLLTGDRQRTWRPKTRTGCQNCRLRKVKCDEQLPACLRCVKTGRKCGGYLTNFIAYRKTSITDKYRSRSQQSPSIAVTGDVPTPVAPPRGQLDGTGSSAAMGFYVQCLGPLLDVTFQSSVWLATAMQLGERASYVQSSILSLSTAYLSRVAVAEGSARSLNLRHLAYAWHLRAIAQLRRCIESLSQGQRNCHYETTEAVVLTCLMLLSFNLLLGDRVAASLHFCKGLQLLNNTLPKHTTSTLAELDAVYGAMNGEFGRFPILNLPSSGEYVMPASFASFTQALVSLDIVVTGIFNVRQQLLRGIVSIDEIRIARLDLPSRKAYETCVLSSACASGMIRKERIDVIVQPLVKWTDTLQNSAVRQTFTSYEGIRLECRRFHAQVLFTALFERFNSASRARLEEKCSSILRLADEYTPCSLVDELQNNDANLATECDLFMAVFYVGAYTVNSDTRWRALHILRTAVNRGYWKGCNMLASAVDTIISLEWTSFATVASDEKPQVKDEYRELCIVGVWILLDRNDPRIGELVLGKCDERGRTEVIRRYLPLVSEQPQSHERLSVCSRTAAK